MPCSTRAPGKNPQLLLSDVGTKHFWEKRQKEADRTNVGKMPNSTRAWRQGAQVFTRDVLRVVGIVGKWKLGASRLGWLLESKFIIEEVLSLNLLAWTHPRDFRCAPLRLQSHSGIFYMLKLECAEEEVPGNKDPLLLWAICSDHPFFVFHFLAVFLSSSGLLLPAAPHLFANITGSRSHGKERMCGLGLNTGCMTLEKLYL